MSSPAPFEPIAGLLERSLSLKHVYGEPVQHEDTTVIPVATVAYGFGAGGGRGPGGKRATARKKRGAGGGGGVRMTPVGAVEVRPEGTRFVEFRPLAPLVAAAAFGVTAGWVFGRRRN